MVDFFIAMALKSFFLFAIVLGIAVPIRLLVQRKMKGGPLKKTLLTRIGE
jgi:hypothetical protein